MPDNAFPAPAFYFHIIAGADTASFQEASGIGREIEVEDVQEGGENRFHHRLPKGLKHQNLKLKRGLMNTDGELISWCKNVLEGGLSQPIETKTVTVELLDTDQKPLRTWIFHDAYPVKWEVDPFNAKSSEVAIEALELAYKTAARK